MDRFWHLFLSSENRNDLKMLIFLSAVRSDDRSKACAASSHLSKLSEVKYSRSLTCISALPYNNQKWSPNSAWSHHVHLSLLFIITLYLDPVLINWNIISLSFYLEPASSPGIYLIYFLLFIPLSSLNIIIPIMCILFPTCKTMLLTI